MGTHGKWPAGDLKVGQGKDSREAHTEGVVRETRGQESGGKNYR